MARFRELNLGISIDRSNKTLLYCAIVKHEPRKNKRIKKTETERMVAVVVAVVFVVVIVVLLCSPARVSFLAVVVLCFVVCLFASFLVC